MCKDAGRRTSAPEGLSRQSLQERLDVVRTQSNVPHMCMDMSRPLIVVFGRKGGFDREPGHGEACNFAERRTIIVLTQDLVPARASE